MNFIRQIRAQTGISQSRLAQLSSTSQPTIAAYESGQKSPTLRTFERIANAAGLEVSLSLTPRMSREDRRSLAFHRAIAHQLNANPDEVILKARSNLKKLRKVNPGAGALLSTWQQWLQLPVNQLAGVIQSVDLHAREMRQVSPFSGILSAAARNEVLKKFRMEENV